MVPGEHTGIMDLVSSVLGNHNVFDKLLSRRHYYMLFIFILTYYSLSFNDKYLLQPHITKLHNHVFDYVFYVGFCSCEYIYLYINIFLNMIYFSNIWNLVIGDLVSVWYFQPYCFCSYCYVNL